MEQLVMRWRNDGSPAVMPQVPEGLGLTALPEMKDGVEQWLDVVQYGLSEGYPPLRETMKKHLEAVEHISLVSSFSVWYQLSLG